MLHSPFVCNHIIEGDPATAIEIKLRLKPSQNQVWVSQECKVWHEFDTTNVKFI